MSPVYGVENVTGLKDGSKSSAAWRNNRLQWQLVGRGHTGGKDCAYLSIITCTVWQESFFLL